MRVGSCAGSFREKEGIWVDAAIPADCGAARPALFLDRDGVIVAETEYLCREEDVAIIEGAADIVSRANSLDIPVVVVTNQAGIGRGMYEWKDFEKVDEIIRHRLAVSGARLDAVLACPFHPQGVQPWRHDRHPARKPNPGMLFLAARLLNLDLANSWIVGDHSSDIEAGYNAGLRGALHVLTGHGTRERESVMAVRGNNFEVRLGSSIQQALPLIDLLAGCSSPKNI